MTPQLGVQLYSVRTHPPLADRLAEIAAAGATCVETWDALHADPVALRRLLDAHGLAAPTAHLPLARLDQGLAGTVALARTLGVTTVVVPHLAPADRPEDAAGWRALGGRLQAHARALAADGLALAWHNHAFELETLPDGTTPLEQLLDAAPGLGGEADLGWLARAGVDPAAWLLRWPERVVAAHVKDVAPPGTAPRAGEADEDGWADLGHGTLDRDACVAALLRTAAGVWLAEHDRPADATRFVRRSLAGLTDWAARAAARS
jgi:sugar phosphate isomerase/epimerase